MIVVFSEENQRITATALDGAEQRWQEQVEKAQLATWLKQAADAGRLRRQDALLAVVPETQLTRRIFALPPQAKPAQRRAMAVHALTAVMQERPAALALQQLDAAGHCAVCACKEETLRTLRAPFANYARRLRFVGAADVALARGGPCDDGWYQLTALLWTAVIAVQDGRVVAGHADNSSAAFALEQALREEYRALDLAQPDKVGLLTPDTTAGCDGARLLPCALQPLRAAGLSLREDRTLAALLLLCLVLPGALLFGSFTVLCAGTRPPDAGA